MRKEAFDKELQTAINRAEEIISMYMPEEDGMNKKLVSSINYSVNAGGKRIRPILLMKCAELFNGDAGLYFPFVAAIEMIHTYSLVHDDLPAMDNDELRRGKPTTWKTYGDDFGVLCGDGLLNLAMETALKAFEEAFTLSDMDKVSRALRLLFFKSGIYGMIGGQSIDVEMDSHPKDMDMDTLMYIYKNKTAALLEAAMMVGGILGGANEEHITLLEECAYNLGIAFQIRDDILDVCGDEKSLGKPIGSDADNNKNTYVCLVGLQEAQKKVVSMSDKAIELLKELPGDSSFLQELILQMTNRIN